MDSVQQQYWAQYEEAGECFQRGAMQQGVDSCVSNQGTSFAVKLPKLGDELTNNQSSSISVAELTWDCTCVPW